MSNVVQQKNVINQDIVESLQSRTDLEEELYSLIGQLEALCAVQLTLATEGLSLSSANHIAYSQVLNKYTQQLTQTMEQLYS